MPAHGHAAVSPEQLHHHLHQYHHQQEEQNNTLNNEIFNEEEDLEPIDFDHFVDEELEAATAAGSNTCFGSPTGSHPG